MVGSSKTPIVVEEEKNYLSPVLLEPREDAPSTATRALLEGGVMHMAGKYPFWNPSKRINIRASDKIQIECAVIGCSPQYQIHRTKVAHPVNTIFGANQGVGEKICVTYQHVSICKYHLDVNKDTPIWPFHRLTLAIQQLVNDLNKRPGICYTIILHSYAVRHLIEWWTHGGPAPANIEAMFLNYIFMNFVGENRLATDCLDLLIWIKCSLEHGQVIKMPPITILPQIGNRQQVLDSLTIKQRQVLAASQGYITEADGWNWRGPFSTEQIEIDQDFKPMRLSDKSIDTFKSNFHTLRPGILDVLEIAHDDFVGSRGWRYYRTEQPDKLRASTGTDQAAAQQPSSLKLAQHLDKARTETDCDVGMVKLATPHKAQHTDSPRRRSGRSRWDVAEKTQKRSFQDALDGDSEDERQSSKTESVGLADGGSKRVKWSGHYIQPTLTDEAVRESIRAYLENLDGRETKGVAERDGAQPAFNKNTEAVQESAKREKNDLTNLDQRIGWRECIRPSWTNDEPF